MTDPWHVKEWRKNSLDASAPVAESAPKRPSIETLLRQVCKPHPWHGIDPGELCPDVVWCFIECAPNSTFKYEVDKSSGYLFVDRPQKYSSVCPTLYGFIPRTYCGDRVAARCMEKTGLKNVKGDGDPIDVCVLSTRALSHGDLLLRARPIGGLRMIDRGEADDKLLCVIEGDPTMSSWKEVTDIPEPYLNMIRHYFLTYKNPPGQPGIVQLNETYGAEEAKLMIKLSLQDYNAKYPDVRQDFMDSLIDTVTERVIANIAAKSAAR